jgi:RNA polymerase sigma factor (sigma-70 family)
MSAAESPSLQDNVRRVVSPGLVGVPDAELLARFVKECDEAAFELLLWRHGGMVLNLCVRLIGDRQLAEDAFQLTFLTLARKASTVGRGEAVGGWLYRVAYRTALRTRQRTGREQPLPETPLTGSEPDPADAAAWRELRPLLDDEVSRLPEKYRTAFVLCYLQGKTNEEAARELGCPKGTVDSRLARARERLRDRLARRGLAMGMLPLTVTLLQHAGEASLTPECVTAGLRRALAPGTTAATAAGLSRRAIVVIASALAALALTGMIAHAIAYPTASSSSPAAGACGSSCGAGACQGARETP